MLGPTFYHHLFT